ncbi:MAG: hypothetical protein ACLPQS_16605 [Acidimicrobiales bacterium]
MRHRRITSIALASALAAVSLAACGSSPAASKTPGTKAAATTTTQASPAEDAATNLFPKVAGSQILTLQASDSYTPHAADGGTDDYHCTLVNPHLKVNSYIVATHFYPNSDEVHHAILFEVPPDVAAEAEAADHNGKGWTCFGETALGQGLAQLGSTPWLAAWAPGHGLDVTPPDTGVYFPKGSLVIMQVHYNLLEGDKPVHVQLKLQTVPAATHHLIPLHLDLLPAPPDIPCPSGVHGPLCNRAASLQNLGQLFGSQMVSFVNIIEQVCGRNPVDPPGGDTTTCTWPINWSGEILRVTPHMHLLGTGMKVTLDPGTPQAKVLLNDTSYNFDYQRSFTMPKPVIVKAGSSIQVTCTYNPRLRQELPQLRKLPPRYITWGDGTAEEMCLGIITWVAPDDPTA